MSYSSIEWTDVTDNIIVVPPEAGGGWWCRKVSPACANCYAEDWNRFRGNGRPYTGEAPTLVLKSKLIASWAKQTKPRRHFVSSMTDVAGPWLPAAWVHEYLDGMAAAPMQTFQVLTKHPDVLLEHVMTWLQLRGRTELPANVWIGVTVENQARADELIPILLRIPAVVRFLSIEPLLAATLMIRAYLLAGIHWVIVGGESGSKARATSLAAMWSIVAQCRAAGVPVFVKQLGKIVRVPYYYDNDVFRERALDRPHRVIESSGHVWPGDYQPDPGSLIEFRPRHRKGADMTEWPEDLRVRELPEVFAA